MKDFLVRMLNYNDNANRRFIEAIQAQRPAGERITAIFCHILNAHRIWNARIGGDSSLKAVWDVHPTDQWERLNRENFDRSLEVVNGRLDQFVDYNDLSGAPQRSTLFDILVHVVNHSTYHRGQLAILFGNEHKQPPKTDYIAYARELERRGAHGGLPT